MIELLNRSLTHSLNHSILSSAVKCVLLQEERGFAAQAGQPLLTAGKAPIKVIPGFIELEIDGKAKTGICFIVER